MKRTLFYFACILASVTMQAQKEANEYIPLVEMGKQWHVVRSGFGQGYHFIRYMLTNDKVEKSGKTYIKMSRSEDDLAEVYDTGLLREEGRKVYYFGSDMQEEFLMFDYSLKEGDTYETYSYDEQKKVTYKVLSVGDYREGPKVTRYEYDEKADSMNIRQRFLQKWTVCRTDNESTQKTWIEGIGSPESPLANLYDARPVSSQDYLAYVENLKGDLYLPFSFYDMFGFVHGNNMPTGKADSSEGERHHKLIYEQEDNRLHVYGDAFTQCGPNNYAYFIEELTDDPLVRKLHFEIQGIEPLADCMSLHPTDFYVYGFDPNISYIVVDNLGEEHPVVNKTPQIAYRPFIEDNKVWKVGALNTGNPVQQVEYLYFDGDTIIDGKTCKQMMSQRYVSPEQPDYDMTTSYPILSYVGAWYEEAQKVYTYNAANKQFQLMYDFSLDAYDTLQINNDFINYILSPKKTGGIKGFKGVYRDVEMRTDKGQRTGNTSWLEGIGDFGGPIYGLSYGEESHEWFLMSCSVGDEVIYLNDEYEDGATLMPAGAYRTRFDFTHTIKTKPRVSDMEGPTIYGEYSGLLLGINLEALDDAYLVSITRGNSNIVYEKAINAGSTVALSIDISSYPKDRYTVTVENSQESFTGEFETQTTTGISEALRLNRNEGISSHNIYNLQGQRLNSLQRGLNIVNGKKVYVKNQGIMGTDMK